MPVCDPPLTITEPTSTLTRRVFAAANEPLTSWLQASPSRTMCVSCATASGASRASRQTRLTNCGERFKISTSVFKLRGRVILPPLRGWFLSHTSYPRLAPWAAFFRPLAAQISATAADLINLGQLREHRARLRLDVQALIFRCERHHHAAHAAIRLYRLNHAQRFGAHARVRITHQRFQHRVADAHIILHKSTQAIETLQPHPGIGVIA